MQLEQALAILDKHHNQIKSFDVKSLSIFGSVARNEATDNSDIDFVVEFAGTVTFDKYMDLKIFLEDTLKTKVDLATWRSIKPQLKANISKDAIRVA
ncbi:MAG: nucleotidyltransferase family protein [Coleofasciculaceae cyanobacterium SM2_1_6]|nr:nucleotidyltransferase family protein [Coleofasciculaceae cyanobacterium SM2_1_6]